MNTIKLTWKQLTPAWNASADKRFNECLENTEAPCIMHEDLHELTRFEYFEKENNVTMPLINSDLGFDIYELTFNTEQDLVFFTLKWL